MHYLERIVGLAYLYRQNNKLVPIELIKQADLVELDRRSLGKPSELETFSKESPMSYNEMQRYINELFEENKELKRELDELKHNPQKLLYKQAFDAVNYDTSFAKAMMKELTEVFESALDNQNHE
jgi:hypothetical protein